VQAVVEVHDTPWRWLYSAPLALRVGWIDQLVPSQRSANVPLSAQPTAVQAVAEVHDTPLNWVLNTPLGLGATVSIDQLVPFQPSANGTRSVWPFS
jgi:hypothetical protein